MYIGRAFGRLRHKLQSDTDSQQDNDHNDHTLGGPIFPDRKTLLHFRSGRRFTTANAQEAVIGCSQIETGLPYQKNGQKKGRKLGVNQDGQPRDQANDTDPGFPLDAAECLPQL